MNSYIENDRKEGSERLLVTLFCVGAVIEVAVFIIIAYASQKIFDRFYQTDKTKDGSGLGLAIAKAICEQNHWKIHCESDKKYTKFVLGFVNSH